MKRFIRYLNPMTRLGERKYSLFFPLLANIILCVLSEVYAYDIAKNSLIIGDYIIFLNVAFVIYFAFRDGILGGCISAGIPILYYVYIVYTRHYAGQQLYSGIVVIVILGVIYFILGSIIGWLKQTIDSLIEREANEKIRLQTILQQLPLGVVIVDTNGKVIQANKQMEQIMGTKIPVGYTPGVDKELVISMKNDATKKPTQSPLSYAIKAEKAFLGKEFTIYKKDGKQAYIQMSTSLIVNKQKKPIATASIVSDITQQKELELRKDDFVNMASHELKTPLTSMMLYVEALMSRVKKLDDEKAMKALLSIKQQTQRLQTLVSDLLDVSRLQTGKLSFTKEDFRLDSLVSETIESIQGAMSEQKIIFHDSTRLTVYADRFRIYQVITNLLTNAIKYSEEGKEIRVRIKKDNDRVLVSVQDYGIGIAKSEQKKIFERLYQVAGHREKTFPGFGMGLYISKEIVRRHKGTIWVESIMGKGSTFYFSLPLNQKTKKK